MSAIYKYKLERIGTQSLDLPRGAHILSIGNQIEDLVLWALIDSNEPVEQRIFQIFGTGHLGDPKGLGKFLGTVQFGGGALVFHVFEAAQS